MPNFVVIGTLEAIRSKFDENFYFWMDAPGQVSALATAHVDDNELGTPRNESGRAWKTEAHKAFETKFGKVTRVALPLKHCGVRYTELSNGYKMDQDEYCHQAKPMPISADRVKDPESFLNATELTGFRGVLGALLWICITHMEIICETVVLQQEVTKSKIKHAVEANKTLEKVKKYGQGVGLYFPRLTPPLNLASIHDACGARENTSYAQEGMTVILKEDRPIIVDDKTHAVSRSTQRLLGGFCHILHGSSKKAKRVGVSTSRKETVTAVGCQEVCQLVAMRYTNILGAGYNLPLYRTPTVRGLLDVQECGAYALPIDDYGDCRDLFELMTGAKGVPQDRHQRLYVLSLREDRMSGRIRRTILVPTEVMVSDALTKKMVARQLMNLITSGFLFMRTEKSICCRVRVKADEYTEKDLEEIEG